MTLDVGLIGSGGITKAHLPAYRNHPDRVSLAGVCDIDEAAAATIAEEFDVEAWTDYEAFVAEADVEAVDICLPHHLHYLVARAALEAGNHVLVEKPLAISMAECVHLVDLADENDRTLMVGQMQRFDPANVALKGRIEAGELGDIHHARADGLQDLHRFVAEDHWLFDGARAGGGGIISVLIHKLDLLRYFVGDVRRVHALGKTVDSSFTDAEDYAVGLLEFENGALGDLLSTYSAAGFPYGESFQVFGERGVAYHDSTNHEDGGVPQVRSEYTGEDPWAFEPVTPATDRLPTGDPFANEILHFADCVESGAEPLSSGRDNLGTMALVFGLYRSMAEDGEAVVLTDVLADAREEVAGWR